MKTSTMKTILTTAVLCTALGSVAISAQAQLPYYMDDHGSLVYTNDDSRTRARPRLKKPEWPGAGPELSQLRAANSAPAAQTPGADLLHQLVQETAHKHNVDPNLVSAVSPLNRTGTRRRSPARALWD